MKRVLLITAIIYGLALWPGLADPSVFVVAGDQFSDRSDIHVSVNAPGYDGQFFYRLALDPTLNQNVGVKVDNPPYRQQRILYPLLARSLPLPLPWSLVAVNYLGVLAIAVLGVLLARDAGRPGWYGLLFVLWPGFYISLTRDLSEITAAAFLLGGLVLLGLARPWLGAVALSLAVLARETTLVAALSFPLPMALLPLAVYGTWQAVLFARWGVFPALSGSSNLGLPPALLATPWYVVLALFAFIFVVMLSFRYSQARPGLKAAWLGYLVMTLLLTWPVWEDHNAYLRVLTEFYLLGILILLNVRQRVSGRAGIRTGDI